MKRRSDPSNWSIKASLTTGLQLLTNNNQLPIYDQRPSPFYTSNNSPINHVKPSTNYVAGQSDCGGGLGGRCQMNVDEINRLKDLLYRLPSNNTSGIQLTAQDWAQLEMYINAPVNEAERARLVDDLREAVRTPADQPNRAGCTRRRWRRRAAPDSARPRSSRKLRVRRQSRWRSAWVAGIGQMLGLNAPTAIAGPRRRAQSRAIF